MLTLPTSVCHFIYKDLDLGQQYKRADIRNFSNEIVLLGNSDSFQLQISHTNEDVIILAERWGEAKILHIKGPGSCSCMTLDSL